MMNINFKPTVRDLTFAAAGIVLGGTVGYIIVNKRATIMVKAHLDALDEVYEDTLARVQKTGPYASAEEAAAVLLQDTENVEPLERLSPTGDFLDEDEESDVTDEEVAEDEAAYLAWNAQQAAKEAAEEEHAPKHLVEEYTPSKDDEDPEVTSNLKTFLERHNELKKNENFGGVSYPGQHDDDPEPASSVPGFQSVRDPNGPYVISIDEYMTDDSPFTKVEMTFFDGDGVLIDSRQQPIQENEMDGLIGLKNLLRFGEGTTDPDQVYIRNERLEIDIEVTKDDNTYTRAILNIIPEDEIARSMIKPLRMRDGDGE